MADFGFNDYVQVLLAIAGGLLAWLALSGLTVWAWHRLQGTRRETPAPEPTPAPTPAPVDPRDLCGKCPQRATTSIHGWPLCAEHAAEIHARAPFDREAS